MSRTVLVVFAVCYSFVSVQSIYFSLRDVRVTVPTGRGKFIQGVRPLATFHVLGENNTIDYFLKETSKSIRIDKSNGEVSFTEKFLDGNNYAGRDPIIGSITVTDKSSDRDQTSIQIEFRNYMSHFNCDLIASDLCFWQSAVYRIHERTPPSFIGPLASPYLAEICPGFKINYTIVRNDDFFLTRPHGAWILASKRFLKWQKVARSLNVTCTVENPQETSRSISRVINVEVGDVDDNPPVAQEKEINVPMLADIVVKGQVVDAHPVIFQDRDTADVNKYEEKILDDPLGVLQAHCTTHVNDLKGQPPTAIVCKLVFVKNEKFTVQTYSVILQLNDTTMTNEDEDKVVQVPVHFLFHNDTGFHPATIKKAEKPLILYPTRTVKIFRTAAPYARVTQPSKERLGKARNFTLATTSKNLRTLFAVTALEGIVYVNDTTNLNTAPEIVRLTVSWREDSLKSELNDIIEVMIVLESKQTCVHLPGKHANELEWCSDYQSKKDCVSLDVCAIATGGATSVNKSARQEPRRCTWRGDEKPGDEITTHYATCTPDSETCPDLICDPLEALHELICPQDCTEESVIPNGKNPKTGRGIHEASGICICGSIGHCVCSLKPKKSKNRPEQKTAPLNNTIMLSQANVNKHIGNVTSSTESILSGIGLAHCGTACVLGIVAGVLFLTGTVAMIVICFHLDRVHKTIRSKFGDENQDLSAPLSDYIDRTIPDPMPLNFDMTTSLTNTAILDILNKCAPDPKWEFPRSQLVIEQTLGEGEFGRVLRAKAMNILGQTGYTTVAVKTLKDDARETELNDLLSEYQLLKEVSHPNVIRLLGVCTAPGGPIYLIIEFAEHGSLRNYLRRSRHLKSETFRMPSSTGLDDCDVHYDEPNVSQITPKEILSFAWQICKGMAYLSEIKLVHRDLAARNVLLAADKICKISDFGLTRDIYEDDAYFKRSKGRVPVKWMAPESLSDHVYTNKSDVWSFGILIWELVTLGATPYPGIAVQNLFHLLKQGYRMERPDNCSSTLYNIMRSCWHIEPEHRPSFPELCAVWEKMLTDEVEYLDLTNNAIHNRSYFCSNFEDSPEQACSEKSEELESNPLNYLSKSQSYVKCGAADKFLENSSLFDGNEDDQKEINTPRGYETPVKVGKKVRTPTNDCPQYYTDMASGKIN